MKPSPHIQTELRLCAALLIELEVAMTPSDFEEKWHRLLGHIERVWNKCQHHFGRSPKWSGWKGQYESQRRIDPLLSYLKNARGAHEHTVADITATKSGSISISAGPSGRAYIKHLQVGVDGIKGEWDGDLAVTFEPGGVELVPVTNRGKTYPVPTSHLNRPLEDISAITIGRYGLLYYEALVAKAESHFIT